MPKLLRYTIPPLHERLERILLHLGAFHIIINFMAIIGRRFGSAGLRDVLIEADILETGSVDATLVLVSIHVNY